MFLRRHLLFLAVLLFTIVAYSNTFYADYQFDDLRVILDDGVIKNWSTFFTGHFWSVVNWRPLALFSFAINYKIHGVNVFGFHMVNLFIHLANVAVVYFVTVDLLKLTGVRRSTFLIVLPALIFALHPIQTQAVTYIVQRMSSLSALFYLLSLFFYLKYRQLDVSRKGLLLKVILILLMGFAFVASVLSKQIGVTLPLAILAVEICVFGSVKKLKTYIFPSLGFLVAGIALVYIAYNGLLPHVDKHISRTDYFITQLFALPIYFKLLFTGSGLNIDHYILVINRMNFQSYVGACIYLIMLSLLFFPLHRLIKLSVMLFVFMMLVESSVIPISDILVDHRMYLPLFALSIGFLGVLANVNSPVLQLPVKYTIFTFLLVILSIKTFVRNSQWASRQSLWLDSTCENPLNPRAWNNYGQALMLDGDFNGAIPHLKKALVLDPLRLSTHCNLSVSYSIVNDFLSAKFHLNVLKNSAPYSISYLYAEGVYRQSVSDSALAVKFYTQVLGKDKRNYLARERMASILLSLGHDSESQKQLEILKHLNPDYFTIKDKLYFR